MIDVEIILATYNGEAYLRDQLNSILLQKTQYSFRILISDDGSSDDTMVIIREYEEKHENIRLIKDNILNKGALGRFSFLIEQVRAKYIMFSDQDDFWMPDKIEYMIKSMKEAEIKFGVNTPLMCFSDLFVVDQKLMPIASSFWRYQGLKPKRQSSFSKALVQNSATGCATIINKDLLDIATPIPLGAAMHDWWFFVVAKAFGEAIPLFRPTIKYRQHKNNTLGAQKTSILSRIKKIRYLNDKSTVKKIYKEAQSQSRAFEAMFPDSKYLHYAEKFSNLYSYGSLVRKVIIFRYGFFREGIAQNISWISRI